MAKNHIENKELGVAKIHYKIILYNSFLRFFLCRKFDNTLPREFPPPFVAGTLKKVLKKWMKKYIHSLIATISMSKGPKWSLLVLED